MLKNDGGPLARAIRNGESSHSERLQIRRFNGTFKTIIASASPLRALDGHIVGAVILIQDVTETREIEEELQERVTKLVSLGMELESKAVN
jgi:PAS domain S-box-containing protein